MAQSRKGKREGYANASNGSAKKGAAVKPQPSRTPFFALIGGIVVIAIIAIVFKMQSAPKPITLPEGMKLPKAEGYLLGDPNAPVTIMEFADFECPQCGNFAAITEPDVRKRIVDTGLANLRYFDFPLPDLHPNTLFASLAASCAADQGKFWPMHDLLLAGQVDWEGREHKNPKPVFDGYAKKVGLDETKFNACFDSRDNVTRIEGNRQAGLAYQVTGTPSFVIGGKMYPGNMDYDQMKSLVDAERVKLGLPATADTSKKQ
ncbi:MAG: thioredoxin domain-containing protein [Gemmatimonadaceae bacterium]